jgi:hypothetical protein
MILEELDDAGPRPRGVSSSSSSSDEKSEEPIENESESSSDESSRRCGEPRRSEG